MVGGTTGPAQRYKDGRLQLKAPADSLPIFLLHQDFHRVTCDKILLYACIVYFNVLLCYLTMQFVVSYAMLCLMQFLPGKPSTVYLTSNRQTRHSITQHPHPNHTKGSSSFCNHLFSLLSALACGLQSKIVPIELCQEQSMV